MIYDNMVDLIGNTPVIKYDGIYLKLESFNASGSIKDRAAKWMIDGLESQGKLKKGSVIVEPTSGNTGISLAMIGALKGYKVVLVMPDTMSLERQQLIKAYGAEIILTDGKHGMSESIKVAEDLVENKGYVMPSQFENELNVLAHMEGTAVEIIDDFENLDYLVCGIGTGGTITGLAKVLKKHYLNIKVIGVEPLESPFITQGVKGPHGIQGIGAGFIPPILDVSLIDEVVRVSSDDAILHAKEASHKGVSLGISSGAALKAGLDIKKKSPSSKVLVIAPDNGMKYLSLGVYND